ncbi:MAG: hypothetical protein ABEI27_07455 [Halobellus sp.]|uniref:DUF7504 family protein n=1 Tax=Halobellus sp. TaxID=1979212 RepID=UPI0035D3F95E
MHAGRGSDDAAVGATVGVATALEDLKTRGSALLVVGTVPEEQYARVSGCMLGDASENRRRLVVERGRSPDVRFADIDRWTPEWTRILHYDVDARGSTEASSSEAAGPEAGTDGPETGPGGLSAARPPTDGPHGSTDVRTAVSGSITDLGVEVSSAIDQLNAIAGGLEPAELRVAFDCTASLLSEHDERTVFQFLHLLASDVRRVGAMGHVRLQMPHNAKIVRLLEPLFDAVVELRLEGTATQQRWHFRDAGVTSEWLSID